MKDITKIYDQKFPIAEFKDLLNYEFFGLAIRESEINFLVKNFSIPLGKATDDCSICLGENPDLRIPNCCHQFHKDCLVRWWETTSICPNDRGYVRLAMVKHYHKGFVPAGDNGMAEPWVAVPGIVEEDIVVEIENPGVEVEVFIRTPGGTPPRADRVPIFPEVFLGENIERDILRRTAGRRGRSPMRFQPLCALSFGSPRSIIDDEWDSDGEQPGRLETIRNDSNVNGNDEEARTRLVSDLISQLTVLGRDGNIDADTHQRLMDALDAASALPQPQPQDQNTFGGMNDFMVPTFEGPNQADGEDRRRSTPRENQNYCDDRENSPRDVFKFSQPHG
jgi:hypothetical protein